MYLTCGPVRQEMKPVPSLWVLPLLFQPREPDKIELDGECSYVSLPSELLSNFRKSICSCSPDKCGVLADVCHDPALAWEMT